MKTLVCILLVFGITAISAQTQLTGTIYDQATQKPLDQVSIYFPELEIGAASDEKGQFSFSSLPSGTYKLTASYIGYVTYSESIDLDLGESLTIYLDPSPIEMQEVIVSTPFHKLQRENVMKVEQLPMSELAKTGTPTLIEGLATIPGVSTVSTGASIGKPVIRGLSYNRVVTYAQHIRLENQQFGDEHGLGLSGAGLESIEVIKGPASLLYGSDAMGGVLYLNPERFANPKQTLSDATLAYFSNTAGMAANAGIKSSGEKIKYLLRLSGATHTDYDDGDGNTVLNSRFKEWDLKTGLGFQSGKFRTELRYNLNRSELGLPEEIGSSSTDRDPIEPFQEISNHLLSSRSQYFFDKGSLNLILGFSSNDRKEFETPETPSADNIPALEMRLNTVSYNLQYQLPKKTRFETILGIQGMRQKNSNSGEEVLIPDAETTDIGILSTSHIHFDKSDIQLGVRYDRRRINSMENGLSGLEDYIAPLDRSFNSLNLAAGYRIDLTEKIIARLNLATGFRAPNLAELTSNGVHEGTNRYEIGNPDLENEKNFQTDISLEYADEHWEFYINGFLNKVDRFIYVEPTGETRDSNEVYEYTQQDAKLFGGEAGLHFHPHPLDWLHIESAFQTVIGELDGGESLPLIPANTLRNTIRIESNKTTAAIGKTYGYLSVVNVFNQDKVSVFETSTTGYTLLNVGIGGTLNWLYKDLRLALNVNNLFDKQYISHLSRLKSDGISNMGRNVTVNLKMSL
ncbi:MAG: TonB-dependent receptor [Flavobacteriaceae bacterium]|nr:TonB-dependent receptor [Flavobacteriaceae bacterium]